MKKTTDSQKNNNSTAVKPKSGKAISPENPGLPKIAALAIVAIFGIIIYSNTFDCSFHLDDNPGILMNEKIRDLSDIQTIWEGGTTRFIGNLSLALNYHFGEYNVFGYHLFNLFVHILNAFIVYLLSYTLFETPVLKTHPLSGKKKSFAFFAALLFVSHPLATQSVTYIIQRLASMVTLFYLLSVLSFMKGRLASTSRYKIVFFGISVLSAIAAMHTKENAFTLPISLILVELSFFREKEFLQRLSWKHWLLLVVAIGGVVAFALIRFSTSIFKNIEPELGNTYTLTPFNYLYTQFSVIVKYIQLLFIPVGQNMEYDFPIAESITEPMTLFSLFVLVSILGLAIYLFNRNRLISFGIFWFFITLSVESSIVPISDVIFEHRTYLPSFGFFIILVFVIYSLFGKRSTFSATILFVVIALSYSTLAYARNKVWKTDETLWKDVIEKSPNKARPKVNLGKYYIDRNQTQLAYEQFLAAEKINPNYFDAVQNSGVCELLLSKYDLSIIHIKKAIAIDTASARARYTLGLAYTGKQDWLNAIQSFDDALRIDSLYSRAYWKRGNAFGNLNRWDKALRDYNKTIALDPSNDVAWYERGNIYGIQKDYPKAIENYNGALALNANLVGAYFYRAISYENMNQLDNALSDYETMLRIDPNDSNAKRSRDALLVRMQGGKMANVIKNK